MTVSINSFGSTSISGGKATGNPLLVGADVSLSGTASATVTFRAFPPATSAVAPSEVSTVIHASGPVPAELPVAVGQYVTLDVSAFDSVNRDTRVRRVFVVR